MKFLLPLLLTITLTHALPSSSSNEDLIQVIPIASDRTTDLIAAADESAGGYGGSSSAAASGGWGEQAAAPAAAASQGWGWPATQKGWGWPKFKYLKFTIPIPILPRIKFGIKGGLKLNAALQHPKGWGWRR